MILFMKRRQFLRYSLAVPIIALSVTKVIAMARHYPLQELLLQLKRLPPAKLSSHGQWNVSTVLQHLAQSVRYSRLGYPEAKPAWFQHTAGSAAFTAFAAAGTMQHPLDDPIPGAPPLIGAVPNDVALAELVTELE